MEFFHSGLPKTFLGVKGGFAKAKYVVISSPYEGTVTYGAGTRNGPQAIIDASRQVETYDEELGKDFSGCGIFTCEELEVSHLSAKKNCAYVQEAVKAVLDLGKVPVLLGGEHSVSIGAFDALHSHFQSRLGELSVLHLDAHADMRNEYGGTEYSHACAMRRCREKLHAVSVGVRSLSGEEAEEIRLKNYDVFGPSFDEDLVVGRLRKNIYISIDMDVFDPSQCPAVGTPEPGGLLWAQAISLLKKACQKKNVVGFDLVELAPIPCQRASEFLAARLAYKIICYIENSKG